MAMGLSMKVILVSTTVLSTAVMLKLSVPFLTNFALSDLPTLWTSLMSWLRPPYLYVIINFIIISILASSRLQSKVEDFPTLPTEPTPVLLPAEPVKVVLPDVQEVHDAHVPYDGVVLGTQAVEELTPRFYLDTAYSSATKFAVPEPDLSPPEFKDDADTKTVTEAHEEIMKNSGNESLISKSSLTPSGKNQIDFAFPLDQKPPASARFSHRKSVKASAEGVRTLGVSKPKRPDTLESTWKTITEGRSIPLTRHLRKSDTWETHGHGRQQRNSEEEDYHSQRMTKSETFTVNRIGGGGGSKPPLSSLSRSTGSGKLKKEASVGQEELNRRVEAFIRKFNEDMRLQRQESLDQYMEMINRGAH